MTTAEHCIAVVDDEAPVRTMLRRVLRLADYVVETFASGDDFLAWVAGHDPACVVLDLHMPGLSGFEIIARLERLRPGLPVVCITASDDATLDRAVHEAGGVALLRKPFPSDRLLEAVAAALRGAATGMS